MGADAEELLVGAYESDFLEAGLREPTSDVHGEVGRARVTRPRISS
jgi:hypothetical protein